MDALKNQMKRVILCKRKDEGEAIFLNCTLMHKNTPVVDLVIDADSGIIDEAGHVHHEAHLPLGTITVSGVDEGKLSRHLLSKWWNGRTIPASRDSLERVLLELATPFASALAVKCYGLSLSDQYWIRPDGTDLEWSKVNFFQNEFSTDMGELLFGKEFPDRSRINAVSPDNTSDGWLEKKWIILDGKRLLMKGGSGPYQQEPLNELVACAVMKRLEITHIPYTLTFENGQPYSLCETFVTPETELISSHHVAKTKKWAQEDSLHTHLLRCAGELGIPNVPPAIEKMLVLDYIIANTDRHHLNFGFLRHAETLEWLGFAPIYDSGTSLWHNTQFVGRAPRSKSFEGTHEEQITLVRDFSWFDYRALHDLGGECAEIFAKSELIDEKRRDALVRAIEARVKEIEQMRNRSLAKPSLAQRLAAAEEGKIKVQDATQEKQSPRKDKDER